MGYGRYCIYQRAASDICHVCTAGHTLLLCGPGLYVDIISSSKTKKEKEEDRVDIRTHMYRTILVVAN
jgi:hypothetical protein